MILSWQENMPKEEIPPVGIWLSDSAITEWFEDLDVRRETKHSNADITGWEQPDEDDMETNDLASQYRKQIGL